MNKISINNRYCIKPIGTMSDSICPLILQIQVIKKPIIILDDDDISVDDILKKYNEVDKNFEKCVQGYHLFMSLPIKETIWEDINANIFSASGIDVYSKSDGSHSSGMDIECTVGRISNKSVKYSKNKTKQSFDISSYRLSSICSDKSCGNSEDIINEINKRKNFDYYSIIARDDEPSNEIIHYDWLLIPSNYYILNPSSYTWEPLLGKQGKNKNTQIGWKTNTIEGCSMKVTFGMSSQLWIHVEMTEELKNFIVASTKVLNKPKYSFINIQDKLI